MRSEALRRAQAKRKGKLFRLRLEFREDKEPELVAYIEGKPNRQGFIRGLILREIEREKAERKAKE